MGQTQFQGVRSALPGRMVSFTDRLMGHATEIKQLTSLTYEQFIESITTLNQLAESFTDANGKKLVFHVKKGTDESVFWRTTVYIKCSKVNSETGSVELTKLLPLKQYVHIYNEITRQALGTNCSRTTEAVCSDQMTDTNCLDSSILIQQIDAACADDIVKDDEECIICMDRQATIILPCAHAYCEQCIDAWQGSHKNCPICRATVKDAKESWVLSEKPDEHEMANEASGYVMGLIDSQLTDHDSSDE